MRTKTVVMIEIFILQVIGGEAAGMDDEREEESWLTWNDYGTSHVACDSWSVRKRGSAEGTGGGQRP